MTDEELVVAAFLALQRAEPDEDELRGPVRRAVLLLAAGGDPQRELDLDGRAVTALAAELPDSLVERVLPELPVSDAEQGRRALAAALLADEVTGDD